MDNEITIAHNRTYRRHVGRVATYEQQCFLNAQERRNLALKLVVEEGLPSDQAAR